MSRLVTKISPLRDAQRPVLTYLKGILASLNPTDRLIADCVLADPEKVVASSIAEIKEICVFTRRRARSNISRPRLLRA